MSGMGFQLKKLGVLPNYARIYCPKCVKENAFRDSIRDSYRLASTNDIIISRQN
jgi:hypothetical protein